MILRMLDLSVLDLELTELRSGDKFYMNQFI